MSDRVHALLNEALGLSAGERAVLMAALMDSLESKGDSATLSEAWRAELRQRRDELRAAGVCPVRWTEARSRLSAL